jgi:uncharacterized OsmC-like protein
MAKMAAVDDIKSFDVAFECDATAVGKMRCEMDVRLMVPEVIEWEMASDEYGFHGGDGSAPLPIAYFIAGLTSCLMTQMRAFSKRLRVDIENAKIFCRCEWVAIQKGRAPYESAPKSIHMDISMDSDASLEDQLRLIEAAKKGCFIEAMLTPQNNITHRLKTADGWVDC